MGRHGASARVIGLLAGWGGLAAAVVYFVNGLTTPAANVLVRVTSPALELSGEGSEVLTSLDPSARYYFSGLEGADRALGRLDLVLFWSTVAAIGFALAALTRRSGATDPTWVLRRCGASTVLGLSIAALGVLPSLGASIAASTVLERAGSPAGISPPEDLHLGAVAAGVGYLVVVLAVDRARRSASVASVPSGHTGSAP